MKKKVKIILVIFLVASLLCLNFIIPKIATDTYNIMNIGLKRYAIKNSLTDGRLINGILLLILSLIPNLSIVMLSTIFEVIAIFILSITVYLFANRVINKEHTKWEKVFIYMTSFFTIFNFCFIENLYFIECLVMSLSMLFYYLASTYFIDKKYFKSFIFLYLGIISYQGTISAFFLFTSFFLILNKEKDLLKRIVPTGIVVGSNLIISILQIKIISGLLGTTQDRLTSIFDNIKYLFSNFIIILTNTGNILGKYSYLIMIGEFFLLLILLKVIKDKKIKLFLEELFLLVCGVVFAFIPAVISTTAFESMRTKTSYGMVYGILLLFLILRDGVIKDKDIVNKFFILVMFYYFIMTSGMYLYHTNLIQKVNKLDNEVAMNIKNDIDKYEKENNIKVTKLYLAYEEEISIGFYESVPPKNIMTVSALRTSWSSLGAINYYTGKKLELVHDEVKINSWYNMNRDIDKGYIIYKDTLYISISYL